MMARHSKGIAPARAGRLSRLRIPPRLRPFLRLGLVVLIVIAADIATQQLTNRGGTIPIAIVTIARIASALTILRYPFAGFVFSLEVDKWDWYWLGMSDRSAADQAFYQDWDKVLDLVCLSIAAIVVLQWPDVRAKRLALGMFAWRIVGVAAFEITDQRWLLIVFPNVFETMYLLYLLFRLLSGHDSMLESRRETLFVALALLVPKVGQEIFLHALEERPWHLWHILPSSVLDAWLWGAAMYALPLIALAYLLLNVEGRATRGDPEVQVSAV